MQELTTLHTKLDKLLKKYVATQAEKEELLKTLREQNKEIEKLNGKVSTLESKLNTIQTATVLSGGNGDSAAVKKQLNTLIGDIDKLLATLND